MDKNDLYFLERAETKLKNDNVFQACLPLDRKNPVWADLSQLLLINEKLVLQKHLEAQGASRQVLALLCLSFYATVSWPFRSLSGCASN
jgi:hypothetical protein